MNLICVCSSLRFRRSGQDYLLAPMPFLVGVPAAQQFTALRSIPLEEVLLVDLDAGTCTPGADLPPAQPSSLPYAEELAAAFQVPSLAAPPRFHHVLVFCQQVLSVSCRRDGNA